MAHLASVCARLILAGVFATAAAGKLLDREGTKQALLDFRIAPPFVPVLSGVLPAVEASVALGLLFSPSARWAALGAAVVLAAFMIAIAAAVRRGEAPECHCFGQLHSEPAGLNTLVRNALLVGIAAIVVLDASPPGLLLWLSHRSVAELLAIAVVLS